MGAGSPQILPRRLCFDGASIAGQIPEGTEFSFHLCNRYSFVDIEQQTLKIDSERQKEIDPPVVIRPKRFAPIRFYPWPWTILPQVVMGALPEEWDGQLLFVEHNAGLVRLGTMLTRCDPVVGLWDPGNSDVVHSSYW